ncbi:MAG: hypothetical protein QFE16_16765 [Pseudomonadota bacterium]|nr:hypothetical protein [Pseudomonadota bacterium]
MTTHAIADIQALDAELAQLSLDAQPLNEAMRRAHEMTGAETEPPADLTAARKRTVADFLLGLTKRASVDAIEAELHTAQDKADAARRDAELARLGADEIDQRLRPINEQIGQLQRRRKLLQRMAIREAAEEAALRYREALRAAIEGYAVVRAHDDVLREIERHGEFGAPQPEGGYLSFSDRTWPKFIVPAFPTLRAFEGDCNYTEEIVEYSRDRMNPRNRCVSLDFAPVLAGVLQSLAAKGLL